jgi:hypothetical protein
VAWNEYAMISLVTTNPKDGSVIVVASRQLLCMSPQRRRDLNVHPHSSIYSCLTHICTPLVVPVVSGIDLALENGRQVLRLV